MKMTHWSKGNFHGAYDGWHYGFSTHLSYFDVKKRPSTVFLLFLVSIGFGHFGDPLYSSRRFNFAIDALHWRMSEGSSARIHFSFPLPRVKFKQHWILLTGNATSHGLVPGLWRDLKQAFNNLWRDIKDAWFYRLKVWKDGHRDR